MRLKFPIALALASFCSVTSAQAANFDVSNLNDAGAGSLRQAMIGANGATGPHVITFSATGTINLASALPELTQPVSMDGDTNNDGIPDVIVNGNGAGAGANGLVIRGGSTTVRGLVIQNFTEWGLILRDLGGNTIVGNYLGLAADGQAGAANDQGELWIDEVGNNQIGGTVAADRNVIGGSNHGSACDLFIIDGNAAAFNKVQGNYIGVTADGETESSNCQDALRIDEAPDNTIGGDVAGAGNVISGSLTGLAIQSNSPRTIVQGNLIGTDKDGLQAIGNSDFGMLIQSADNQIGGTTPLARNVISGNGGGILFSGGNLGSDRNIIQGNLIGTDITGNAALPNDGDGINLQSGRNNTVGGTVAGARNIISGNVDAGVLIPATEAEGNVVLGNYIGTNISGTAAIPNLNGVEIASGAHDNTVGGLDAASANVLSGNLAAGLLFEASVGSNNVVQGNLIGLNAAGTAALPNDSNGVRFESNTPNLLGGSDPAARNVISGNDGVGVFFQSSSNGTVQGNYIGTDPTGTSAIANADSGIFLNKSDFILMTGNLVSGNSETGIQLFDTSDNNTIVDNKIGTDVTGTLAIPNSLEGVLAFGSSDNSIGSGNIIAFNLQNGVLIQSGERNYINANSIFENGQLGISLNSGAGNLGQPAPALSAARIAGNQLNAVGTLSAAPNTDYLIEFFANEALDPSGFGEGKVFLGQASTTTDGAGNAAFDLDVAMVTTTNLSLVTAVAIDPVLNTSEFSNGVTAILVGSVQFSASSYEVDKDAGTATVTVTRSGGDEGDIAVDFATADGTCVAGQDYQTVAQTLNFPAGETSVEVQVPVLDNGGNEDFCLVDLTLSNPEGGTILGDPSAAILTIFGSPNPVPTPAIISGGGCSLTIMGGTAGGFSWLMGLGLLGLGWCRRKH